MLKGEKLKVWLNLLTAVNCCGVSLYLWIFGEKGPGLLLMSLSGLVSLVCGFVTLVTLIELKDRENQLNLSESAKFMNQIALVLYTFPIAYAFRVIFLGFLPEL